MEPTSPYGSYRNEGPDIARELAALDQTIRELHEANRRSMEERRRELDVQIAAIVSSIHALELTTSAGDSTLHERLAVHEATAHHGGTMETLTAHEAHLARHDGEITKIRQRLQIEDGRIAAQTASRSHRYAVLTVLAAIMAAVGAVLGPVLAEIVKAWTALFGSGGHPR